MESRVRLAWRQGPRKKAHPIRKGLSLCSIAVAVVPLLLVLHGSRRARQPLLPYYREKNRGNKAKAKKSKREREEHGVGLGPWRVQRWCEFGRLRQFSVMRKTFREARRQRAGDSCAGSTIEEPEHRRVAVASRSAIPLDRRSRSHTCAGTLAATTCDAPHTPRLRAGTPHQYRRAYCTFISSWLEENAHRRPTRSKPCSTGSCERL